MTTALPSRRRLLQTLGAGSAVAASPLLFSTARAQGGPIKIGFPTPLTGAFSAEAQDQVRAAELAVKEFNAAGGYKGRLCELLVRDDKLNPGEAATRTLVVNRCESLRDCNEKVFATRFPQTSSER